MRLANGYETKTTFWEDFTIAEVFGDSAVKDTLNRVFKEWKNDITYVTELAVVTNLKCWQWYERGNDKLSKLYSDYYYKVQDYVYSHFKGEDIDYYFNITD